MIDTKLLRKETKLIAENLHKRGFVFEFKTWNQLETKRKELQKFNEEQQSKLNEISKEIGIKKTNSIDSSDALILIDANALDSGRAISLIDSAYVQARVTAGTDSDATIALINAHALDSARATSLIDSAYVQLRVTAGTDSATTIALIDEHALDSGRATKLIDSAYVRFRETPQDFAYASLTGKPTIPTFGVDFVDSGYVSGVLPKFGTDFVDSAATLILIDANALDSGRVIDLIDSSYIQLRQSATGGTDFIFKTIAVAGQSNVVADTTTDTLTLVGGDNVTITTDAASDTITFTASVPRFGADFIDSAAALTLIDANALDSGRTTSLVDSSYVEARGLVKQTSIVLSSAGANQVVDTYSNCLLYTSPSPRDRTRSRMPSSA